MCLLMRVMSCCFNLFITSGVFPVSLCMLIRSARLQNLDVQRFPVFDFNFLRVAVVDLFIILLLFL